MWTVGSQPVKNYQDFNYEFARIQGELSDEQAKIVLVKFLRTNSFIRYS